MPVELHDAKRDELSRALLDWYEAHARALPWRSPPGAPPPDPYRVWLAEVMLQQTTVATVRPRYERFLARWPTVQALAAAEDADVMHEWAGLGYYARARNLLACASAVAASGFPDTEAGLRALPGIGRYTAAAIAAIAFGRRAVVVDGNVERVVARLFASDGGKDALYALADSVTPEARASDFAQAMMDLGATVCTPRSPCCNRCPLTRFCAADDPERYPVRAAKAARPQRYGTAFWLERDGAVLLVTRPAKGLLGGMRALPTGPWTDAPPLLEGAPIDGNWRLNGANVAHGFTHFALDLAIARLRLEKGCGAQLAGEWWPVDAIEAAGLPTVFRKAALLAREGSA